MSNYSLVSWVQLTVTRLSASERRNRINLFVPAAPVPERLPGVRVSVAGRQRHAHSQSGSVQLYLISFSNSSVFCL